MAPQKMPYMNINSVSLGIKALSRYGVTVSEIQESRINFMWQMKKKCMRVDLYFPTPLNYTEDLSTLTALLKWEAKVIN